MRGELAARARLDEWIRRRVRICCWKQWRWVRTKIKRLLNLGVSLTTAIRAWRRQQKLLAYRQTPGAAAGRVQRVVESARAAQRQRPVVPGPGHYGSNFAGGAIACATCRPSRTLWSRVRRCFGWWTRFPLSVGRLGRCRFRRIGGDSRGRDAVCHST